MTIGRNSVGVRAFPRGLPTDHSCLSLRESNATFAEREATISHYFFIVALSSLKTNLNSRQFIG